MKLVAVLLALVGALVGCGASQGNADSQPTGDASRGAALFVKDRCVTCHMVNGVGGDKAPDLTNDPFGSHFDSLKATLQNPPTTQMDFVRKLHLTDQQIADMSAFLSSNLTPKWR